MIENLDLLMKLVFLLVALEKMNLLLLLMENVTFQACTVELLARKMFLLAPPPLCWLAH
jgi:hypothetical protein